MKADYEKIQAALDTIDARISSIDTDKEWLAYLTFHCKFYNYSALNSILIWCQNAETSYVMGIRSWNKIGRSVKKGEKAIRIFAPVIKTKEVIKSNASLLTDSDYESEIIKKKVLAGFQLVSVFDLSQTTGDDSKLPLLITGLSSINSETECITYERIKTVISKKVNVIEVTNMTAKGSYNRTTNQICVREDISPLHKVKTLIHEFAHYKDYMQNPEPDISRNKRELVAESVAYIVSQKFNIDTANYSISYLKSWMKDNDELRQIADNVQKISYEIIQELALSEDDLDGAVSA